MSPSRYWELTVGVPADLSEGLTNLVWELGALGVVEEEQPGQSARLRAFFPETASACTLEQSVRDSIRIILTTRPSRRRRARAPSNRAFATISTDCASSASRRRTR